MAKNKSSKFGVADGFFDDNTIENESYEPIKDENTSDNSEKNTDSEQIAITDTASSSPEADTKMDILDRISDDKLTNMIREYQKKQANKPKEIGDTRGRKGMKLQRINMCYSDKNYEYVKYESRRRGLSATEFVNKIIEDYRNSPDGYID